MPCTFVSMFINLSRVENNTQRRRAEEYFEHAKKLLQRDIFLYLFVEEDMMPLCMEERHKHNLLYKTVFKPITFETLPYYAHYEKIKQNRKLNPVQGACGFKDTPSYIVTVNSKIALVNQVIEENHFGSTHFGWVDFGLFHVASDQYIDQDNTFEIKTDQIKLEFMQPIHHTIPLEPEKQYTKLYGMIAAGYMTGDMSHWKQFKILFEEEFYNALLLGYAPSEEQIFPVIMIKHPHFFDFYFGTYESILNNYHFQRTELEFLDTQLSKAKRVDTEQAARLAQRVFSHMKLGYMQDQSPSTYMGFLIQTNSVFMTKYGIRSQEAKEVRKFFRIKTVENKYALYRNRM